MFSSEMSGRGFATACRADRMVRTLRLLSGDDELAASVVQESTRPNGDLNVRKFARAAERRLMQFLRDEEGS